MTHPPGCLRTHLPLGLPAIYSCCPLSLGADTGTPFCHPPWGLLEGVDGKDVSDLSQIRGMTSLSWEEFEGGGYRLLLRGVPNSWPHGVHSRCSLEERVKGSRSLPGKGQVTPESLPGGFGA